MRKVLFALVAGMSAMFALVTPASAGTSSLADSGSQVTLFAIEIGGTNTAVVWFQGGTKSGTHPACASGPYPMAYSFDISTSKGKAMLATATAAYLGAKPVSLTGQTGTGNSCLSAGSQQVEVLTRISTN